MKGNKLGKFIGGIITYADEHKREALLACTIVGVASATIVAWRNSPKAHDILDKHRAYMETIPREDKEARRRGTIETAKDLAPLVLPPVALAGLTIASAVGGHSASTKQIAALSAAYTFSEKKLMDYTEKTLEAFGEKKAEAITDAICQDKVINNPPKNETIINTGKGQTLCYDDYSGRYFYSDAESIRRATNEINRRLIDEYYISLNDYYEELGLPNIGMGSDLGFCVDDMLNPTFSTTLTEDDRPCLVLNYTVSPKYGYGDLGGPKFCR